MAEADNGSLVYDLPASNGGFAVQDIIKLEPVSVELTKAQN